MEIPGKLFLYLMIVWSETAAKDTVSRTPDEQRLMEELFPISNYDAKVRPVYNWSDNVEITFGFTLLQIMDMEETSQVMTTNAWLEMSWLDERIYWDPEDYNGLKVLRIPADMLWLPDIVLYNNADDFTSGFHLGKAMVFSDGGIFWGPPVRLRSSCPLNTAYFPFDTQICSLKFASWIHDTSQVDILNMRPNVDVTRYVSNGEWHLTNYTSTRHETTYPGVGTYSDVNVVLVIQRRILYYIVNILFSCIWLSILTLLDFCLPPDEGEKITLGTTVLLAYAFFMLMVANSVPPSSKSLPLLSVYLTLSLAVNSFSLGFAVLALKLHHSPAQRQGVPNWVRVLVLQHLARLVRCNCPTITFPKKENKTLCKEEKSNDIPLNEVCKTLLTNAISWTPADGNLREDDLTHDLEDVSGIGASTPVNLSRTASFSEERTFSFSVRKTVVNQISMYLGNLVGNAEEDLTRYRINSEWKQVALVVDRLLFWIFLSITFCATIVILLILPSILVTEKGAL